MKVEEALEMGGIFLDVRSPKEFEEATIPGAINIPILDNEERAVVGLMYKEKGPDLALEKGKEIFSKKLDLINEKIEKLEGKIVVFCWRGGMRSKAFVDFLKEAGKEAYQLEGGYKQYRAYVRKRLENYNLKPKLVVVSGLTGVGKTELINKFENSIDLEGLAQHRSSLLGAIGLKPRSQKMFDSLLLERLDKLQNEKWILIEGESRKVGNIMVPDFLYKEMKKGIQFLLVNDFNERVIRLVNEYVPFVKDYKLKKIVDKMNISKKIKEQLKAYITAKCYKEFTEIMLKEYYDPLYKHTLKKINYDWKIKFKEFENIEGIVEKILNKG